MNIVFNSILIIYNSIASTPETEVPQSPPPPFVQPPPPPKPKTPPRIKPELEYTLLIVNKLLFDSILNVDVEDTVISIVPSKTLVKWGLKGGRMLIENITEQDYEKISDAVSTMVFKRQAIHIKSHGELMANADKNPVNLKLPKTTSILQLCVIPDTWH